MLARGKDGVSRKALREQDRSVHIEWSARVGVGVVSISGDQIACLQAQMPIDLEEKCRGKNVGARPVSDSESPSHVLAFLECLARMVRLVSTARGALVVFSNVCR